MSNGPATAAENLGSPDHWLTVLRSEHKTLRRLVGFGWVLFVAVVADWGFQYERLADETPLLISAVEELGREQTLFAEGRRLYFAEVPGLLEERPEVLTHGNQVQLPQLQVPLRKLPQFLDAVARKVDEDLPQRENRIGGFELPLAYYRLALLATPLVIFAMVMLKLWRVSQLRRILEPFARQMGEVQQVLNSPFYERITRVLGEARLRHTLMVLLLHSPILLSAWMYVPAVLMWQRQNLGVLLSYTGQVKPAHASAFVFDSMATALVVVWTVSVVLSLVGWVSVAFFATRKV